jgi:hypothetical protein
LSFVNFLLTALKQKEQITNRFPRLDNTFNVTFLTGLEKFVKTVKSKCKTIFKRFGSFRDVVSNNFVCNSFLGKLGDVDEFLLSGQFTPQVVGT